jgi:hypothetical protein
MKDFSKKFKCLEEEMGWKTEEANNQINVSSRFSPKTVSEPIWSNSSSIRVGYYSRESSRKCSSLFFKVNPNGSIITKLFTSK